MPDSDLWILAELSGRIYIFPDDPECREATLLVDLSKSIQGLSHLYGLTFHPDFERNHQVFVCYLKGKGYEGDAHVSRFKFSAVKPSQWDLASEEVLITWPTGGHNGGCIEFGLEGDLYISTGDGDKPTPADSSNTGQDISDLKSSILRIDVDRRDAGLMYHIPKDNPFYGVSGARPEVWAYGLRNPWKMTFDPETGNLWTGDVGWDLWEMVFLVTRGGNYGWSLVEGGQKIRNDIAPGPTPVISPVIIHSHEEARSVTGGYVYRGKSFPELQGAYVYGDYVTGTIWGVRINGEKVTWASELARTPYKIMTFAETTDRELLIVDLDGTIHQLVRNPQEDHNQAFPRLLSQTGLFANVTDHTLAPGVEAFAINSPQWQDGAQAARFIALPGTSSVLATLKQKDDAASAASIMKMEFPKDAVLGKTLYFGGSEGDEHHSYRFETQILHYDGTEWHGYTYRWHPDQSDGELVGAEGATTTLQIPELQETRKLQWRFHSRSECVSCHNAWTERTLAWNREQLTPHSSSTAGQWARLIDRGILQPKSETHGADPELLSPSACTALVDPKDHAASLEMRARSYLHANCSHCHRPGAGANTAIDLRASIHLESAGLLGVRPLQGTFQIENAAILAPGESGRSVLFYRISKTGNGRMPQSGCSNIDDDGVCLIHDWIESLDSTKHPVSDQDRFLTAAMADRFLANAPIHSATDRNSDNPEISVTAALQLAHSIRQGAFAEDMSSKLIEAAGRQKSSVVRDLFDPFLPPDQRALAQVQVDPATIFALHGNPVQGRQLFESLSLRCSTCHQTSSGPGEKIGPDLSRIGSKKSRFDILTSLLKPSQSIETQYQSYIVETTSGRIVNGLLVKRSDSQIILRTVDGKSISLPTSEVEQLLPQTQSLMPEQLLADLQPKQIADLLSYLESLK